MHLRTHRQRAIKKQEWRHREKRWPFRPSELGKACRDWQTEWQAELDKIDAADEEFDFYQQLERGYRQDRI